MESIFRVLVEYFRIYSWRVFSRVIPGEYYPGLFWGSILEI